MYANIRMFPIARSTFLVSTGYSDEVPEGAEGLVVATASHLEKDMTTSTATLKVFNFGPPNGYFVGIAEAGLCRGSNQLELVLAFSDAMMGRLEAFERRIKPLLSTGELRPPMAVSSPFRGGSHR